MGVQLPWAGITFFYAIAEDSIGIFQQVPNLRHISMERYGSGEPIGTEARAVRETGLGDLPPQETIFVIA